MSRTWRYYEDRFLIKSYSERLSAAEMAKHLEGRSRQAIVGRIRTLIDYGRIKPGRIDSWTNNIKPVEDEQFAEKLAKVLGEIDMAKIVLAKK